jgi:D-alanine-D-alanine ligase-like ATP-grasp enzyme
MKICILESAYESSDSPMKEHDLDSSPGTYFKGYEIEHHFLHKKTAVSRVTELATQGFDVFVNLCDGSWDEDRAGIEVVQALERLNLPFTGAGSSFYDPTRDLMKMVCRYYDVKVPGHAIITGADGLKAETGHLQYPLIVKHPNSYSSIGLTSSSVVENHEQLLEQSQIMIGRFGQAMVEEFIEGREFTVLVAENPEDPDNPVAYEPLEFRFPPGEHFKHFDLKWINYKGMKTRPVEDSSLAAQLMDASKNLFIGLNGTGYGRCDLRVNGKNEAYMLEINPNCGIFYPPEAEGSADLILLNDERGHKHFVKLILESAGKRVVQKSWKRAFHPEYGYRIVATKDISKDELIFEHEEQSHQLVSRSHVMNSWSEEKKKWFRQYAWPISDETYVMWSPEPDKWTPINHSCEPNAWLTGLNVTARKPIRAGEEITLDYATFCNEIMEPFSCNCGADDCRKRIKGTDYRSEFVREKYGEHVSAYVKRKREKGKS